MHNFRSGDEVNVALLAFVTRVTDDVVRVRFGDTEYDADPSALRMVTRSIHVGDDVVRDGRPGVVSQILEEDVFLVRFEGAAGAGAYAVAARGDITHAADGESAPAPVAPASAPAPAAPAPASAPAETPAPETAKGGDAPLELTSPIAERSATGGVGDMAASLSSMSRTARKAPLDLESVGTTETVSGVGEPRGEMTLSDDLRLGGGTQAS